MRLIVKEGAAHHPRPCGPGCDPLRGSPLAGPRAASVIAHATSFMLPIITARFRERANIVPASSVRHHRSRNVGHGRGFCISPLRLRLRYGCSLWGEGVVACATTPALPQCSALFVGVILPGAFGPGPDHASLLPAARYCQGEQQPHPMRRAR